jgi:hypothetical protein
MPAPPACLTELKDRKCAQYLAYSPSAYRPIPDAAEQEGSEIELLQRSVVAGGTILPKVWKAYRELVDLGLVSDDAPRIHAAQAAGCDPVAKAILSGAATFQPQKPRTIAKSIAIGNPADGPYAIRVVRDSGGSAASASDEEILAAIERLTRTVPRAEAVPRGRRLVTQVIVLTV